MTWESGRDRIRTSLTNGELQQVTGGQAAGDGWLTAARTKLATAALIADATAYDAARFTLVGVLAHQGLRATQKGGHLGVEHAVRAQFGDNFAAYGTLRRRRAELEYPAYPGEKIEQTELTAAIDTTKHIIEAAEKLLPHLTIYSNA